MPAFLKSHIPTLSQIDEELAKRAISEQAALFDRSYLAWLRHHAPHIISKPFAEHHLRFWEWIELLEAGVAQDAIFCIWARGGAKSSTGEMGVCRVGVKVTRRFALYVCGTQDQADLHVSSIADLFEHIGVDRAISRYGNSKGWRRNQLRTANGFNVAGIGLDTASRGIKLGHYRPDLIIFDDIDDQFDSPRTVEKKITAITTAILPAGAPDCAVATLQNLIHEDGVISQCIDGRAKFLLNRRPVDIVPAVIGLKVESVDRGDGFNVWKITEGAPTWEGQDIAVCEKQINDRGLTAFLREAQHEVESADGYFFNVAAFQIIDSLPPGLRLKICRAWDLAATEGGGDWTVGVLMGFAPNGAVYVLDVKRYQYDSRKVRRLIEIVKQQDIAGQIFHGLELGSAGVIVEHGRLAYRFEGAVKLHLPQDPGQAGKDQAEQFAEALGAERLSIEPVSGKKAVRARGFADKVNGGNVYLLAGDWNRPYMQEHRKFREDEEHDLDDQVDASSDAHNELAGRVRSWKFM